MHKTMQVRRARLALAPAVFAPSAADGLEITGLRAWNLREPVSRRAYTVARVQTRSGTVGYGECAGVTGEELEQAARIVTGKPATAFEVIAAQLAAMPRVRAAINAGFSRVIWTLVDTHTAALISAAFLFQFGTGPIRGFAVTLFIGLISNLFTSIFVSKTLFEVALSNRQQVATLSI